MNSQQHDLLRQGPDIFSLVGDLTFSQVDRLLAHSASLFHGPSLIQVDLAQVRRVDSAGVALLIEWIKASAKADKKIVFRNLPSDLLAIAHACGVEGLLLPAEDG